MSDSQSVPEPIKPPVITTIATDTTPPSSESLKSPTFIIAFTMLLIGAGTIAAMFKTGSSEIIAGIGNLVIGLTIGSVSGYFLGSSKHSGTSTNTTSTATPVEGAK